MVRCLYSVLLSIFAACLSTLAADAQVSSAESSPISLDSIPFSELTIPIEIPLSTLVAVAEKNVDTLMQSSGYPNAWVNDDCAMRYKYSFRRSALSLEGKQTNFTMSFMGYYKIEGSTRACYNGNALSPWTPPCKCGYSEAERKVKIAFNTKLTLYNNYMLQLKMQPVKPQAFNKCEMCFWKQDVTGTVLKTIESELNTAIRDVEKQYGTMALRPKLQPIWDQLTKNQSLSGKGFLQLNPAALYITRFEVLGQTAFLHLGLSAKPVVSFDAPKSKIVPLPALIGKKASPGFNIFIEGIMQMDSLNNIIREQIVGKEYDFKKGFVKKKFVFTNSKLYTNKSGELELKIDFKGTNQGSFYLTCAPMYNETTKMIELNNLTFDIKSRDLLLKIADAAFNKFITNEIKKMAQLNIAQMLGNYKTQLNKEINKEWAPGILSAGVVNDLKVLHVIPKNNNLIFRANCSGVVRFKIAKISFN